MSIHDHILIEKYFRNALSEEEQAHFNHRRSADPAFEAEIGIHQQAMHFIQQEGREMLKNKLAEKGKAIDRARRLRKWLGLLFFVLAALLIIKLMWVKEPSRTDEIKESHQPDGSPQLNPSDLLTDDTLKRSDPDRADTQPKKSETIPASNNSTKKNTDALFAAYYAPFEDESLQSGLRGQSSPSPSERFIEAYLKGNYTEALSLFENMDSYDRQNDNMLFIKALSLVGTGGYTQATKILEQVIKRDQARYISASIWYLALTYVKMGHPEKAKEQLSILSQDPTGSYVQKANTLLREF